MDFPPLRFLVLFLLLAALLSVSPACRTLEVRRCKHYNLISTLTFHAFIPKDSLDLLCGAIQSALKCVYEDEGFKKCPSYAYLSFNPQKIVIDAVCQDRKEEYLKSEPCFTQPAVKRRIGAQCMPKLLNLQMINQDPCGLKKSIATCIEEVIAMTDGCKSRDVKLMGDLVVLYLQPTLGKCQDTSDDVTDKEPSPTTEDKATTKQILERKTSPPTAITTFSEKETSLPTTAAITVTTHPKAKASMMMEQKGLHTNGDNEKCKGCNANGKCTQCNLAVDKRASIVYIVYALFISYLVIGNLRGKF